MGASGRWFKSLISHKKPSTNDQKANNEKSKKKWRLWRSSSEGSGYVSSMKSTKKGHSQSQSQSHYAASENSDSSSFVMVNDDAFNAAMATMVVRAAPKDFMAIKQEWAAIRIQSVFRAFLARQALRALRAVVRLQAIFRGRQVRKQAAITLRCMQALVRVQEHVRSRNVIMSSHGEPVNDLLHSKQEDDPLKQAQEGWCDIPGTVDEVKAKIQMKQEAVIKRERAMAYSLSALQSKLSASPKSKATRPVMNNKSLLEQWMMSSKPWESNEIVLPFHSQYQDEQHGGLVKARRNGLTTRISTKPPTTQSTSTSSSSSSLVMSSESTMYDDSPASSTSCTSMSQPSYMNLTESTKAKQRAYCSYYMNINGGDRSNYYGPDLSGYLWRSHCATPQRLSYKREAMRHNKVVP